MNTREILLELKKVKNCCCENSRNIIFGSTELTPPVDTPVNNDPTVLINFTTGVIYYWDGDSWEVYVSGLIAPINATDIADGSVSNTEFQFLGTVTSDVQTQLNGKSNTGHTHVMANVTDLPVLLTGTYNPTPDNLVNLDSVSINQIFYTQVGDHVTIFGWGDFDTTGAGACSFTIDLPIVPTAFNSEDDGAAGTGVSSNNEFSAIRIFANSGTSLLKFEFTVNADNVATFNFHAHYRI